MKKILIWLVILLVVGSFSASGETSIVTTLSLPYGQPLTSEGLIAEALFGEDWETSEYFTSAYIFMTPDGNIIQYTEANEVFTWILPTNETNVLEGLDVLMWMYDAIDFIYYIDIANNVYVVGTHLLEDSLPTSMDFLNEVLSQYEGG